MKYTFSILLFVFVFIATINVAIAASPTPSAKPTSETATENLSDQINNLKEKIASRVAQLNLVEKRGFLGIVKDVDGTVITITDFNDKNRLIDVDEITKFSSSSNDDSFGISDIKPGDKLSVVGLFNKDSQRLLSRFVETTIFPQYVNGTISDKDAKEFTITVTTEGQKEYIIDVENVTKTNSYIDNEPEKTGFTQIEVGTRVMVVGYPDIKIKDRVTATRILLFPELPKNPKIVVTKAATEEVTPSTGSGKTLTPIN